MPRSTTGAWYSYESGTAAGGEVIDVRGSKDLDVPVKVFTFSVANARPCLDLIGKATVIGK